MVDYAWNPVDSLRYISVLSIVKVNENLRQGGKKRGRNTEDSDSSGMRIGGYITPVSQGFGWGQR